MSRRPNNVVPFVRGARRADPTMVLCPVAASLDLSEAIAMLWELREQLAATTGVPKLQRTRFNTLGCNIEDRLERALLSMEPRS